SPGRRRGRRRPRTTPPGRPLATGADGLWQRPPGLWVPARGPSAFPVSWLTLRVRDRATFLGRGRDRAPAKDKLGVPTEAARLEFALECLDPRPFGLAHGPFVFHLDQDQAADPRHQGVQDRVEFDDLRFEQGRPLLQLGAHAFRTELGEKTEGGKEL